MFTKSRPPCSPVGQMTFRNETECWFVKTWRPPYRKCCRNRVCGTSCNSVLFGPIKRREKSRLIGKWRQNWELVVFNRRCKVELRLNRVNVIWLSNGGNMANLNSRFWWSSFLWLPRLDWILFSCCYFKGGLHKHKHFHRIKLIFQVSYQVINEKVENGVKQIRTIT